MRESCENKTKTKFGSLNVYTCKYDHKMLQSDPYPDMSNIIQFRIAAASATNRNGIQKNNNFRQKLANLNLLQVYRVNDIKDEDQLLALAENHYD